MVIAQRYVLDREIGRGGMGAVWLGHDELLGRPVALKKIGMPPTGAGVSPESARAEREAKLAASLSHPHIVSVYDLAPDGDDHWLVMEHVEGTDLSRLVRDNGVLPVAQAAPILAQVADALICAHRAGVVHRDVKPSNILVTLEGQVKLSDFGIARTLGDPSLTQTGLVTGSPAYLSPEVASGRSASAASDVWSLGATAFHMLEGRPPYELGDNLLGALYRIVHEDPPRPSEPGWLAPLFEHTMTDEAARWDAEQVRDFLVAGPAGAAPAPSRGRGRRTTRPTRTAAAPEAVGRTQVLQAVRTSPTIPAVPADEPRRTRLVLGLVALAVVVVVGLFIGLAALLGGDPEDGRADTRPATSSSPAASASPPSTPTAAPAPTSAAMESFIRDYLATAPVDQAAAFTQLTPAFQQASPDYDDFWSSVSDVEIRSVAADPDALTVSYVYSFTQAGERKTQPVTLQLAYVDGLYKIAGESRASA